nr:hypothetical protein [Tanacetum cinerariifolium]
IYRDGKPLTCCECEGPLRGGFCWFCYSRAETTFAYDPNPNSFDDSQNLSDYPPQPQYKSYLCELCGNDSHYGYDCPPRFPLVYEQEPSYNQNYDAANLSIHTPKPSRRFNSICYDDDDEYDYEERTIPLNGIISQIPPSIVITTSPPVLPIEDLEVSLIMGNVDLSTIPEKESDEFIKSSVNLVLILKEKAVTFSNPLFNSNDDFISCDDESLFDKDVPEDNMKIYLNPLFEFDDKYISDDLNPLLDEVLESIKSKDSYDFNFDEPDLLVTPLFDANKDECFDSGGDDDEINVLDFHHDPSIPAMSVASILEGFTDEPPIEENDDLFDLESKNDD